jgi:hypothetical protein
MMLSPSGLAAAAVLAETEIRAWDGKTAQLSLIDADETTVTAATCQYWRSQPATSRFSMIRSWAK